MDSRPGLDELKHATERIADFYERATRPETKQAVEDARLAILNLGEALAKALESIALREGRK